MNIFVSILVELTRLLGGNLGLSIIVIGVLSRIAFYPLLKSSLKQSQILKELKPKLDEVKRKHGHDRQRHAQEQARVYKEAGFNPAAGCLAPIVQLVVAIILLNALSGLLKSHFDTTFLYWNLTKPDTFKVSGLNFDLPGILVILTAVITLIQAKMMLPEPLAKEKNDSKKEIEKKEGLSEALSASQGQFVFLFPLLILFSGRIFPAGLALYWLVSTLVGVIQQYYITGLGGLRGWLKWMPKN